MSRVPTSMRVALVVVLALGPGSAVPCSAIHVLLPVEIIDQSITPVKPRVESLEKNARGRGRHGIEGRTSAQALQLPGFSANNPPAHARERGRKSFPAVRVRAGGGVRSAR